MAEVGKMKARIEAAMKRIDPKVTLLTTFFDEASDRMFVTIVKGPRKILVTLRGRDFTEGADKIDSMMEKSVERLTHMPIG